MKILFEEYTYDYPYIRDIGLCPYFFVSEDGTEVRIPYVGYYFSQEIKDSIFILPKVFLFEGEGNPDKKEIAFGKYRPEEIINLEDDNNPLKKDGFDRIVFGLSVWLYQALARYQFRHPYNDIISDAKIQNVISRKGDSQETYLDIILSLLRFDKEHRNLLTYMAIVTSYGDNKIHWDKTVSRQSPLLRNGVPYYTGFRNRNKAVNHDEEIIVLYYSVLNYLHKTHCFPFRPRFNYPLMSFGRVESMIESGNGTMMLRRIRGKYFKDELVALWRLLYTFFDKAESVASHNYHEEALLVHSFNLVFEDMIDTLIGDDIRDVRTLKDNRDGKRIDHIYEDRSLIEGSDIYFIGDSKYYSDDVDIQGEALYKQFTYAKNIIQYNVDIFNRDGDYPRHIRYRDELTEGYNIPPNFFVRGRIRPGYITGGRIDCHDDGLASDRRPMPSNKHYRNRLFDRDTLMLQSYNINFLYVLSAYASCSADKCFKEKVRKRFRNDMIATFNKRYDFYTLTPKEGIDLKMFVERYFKFLNGKVYRASDSDGFLYLALERDHSSEASEIFDRIKDEVAIEKTTLV